MFSCADCDARPRLLVMNGMCGERDAPGLLPVLVGPPVRRCPVGAADAEVMELALQVPSPHGLGSLAGIPPHTLPPRLRHAVHLANGWLESFRKAGA